MLKRYGDIALSLSVSLLSANLWVSMFRLISSGGVFASHRMLGIGLVLNAPILSRMPWLWIGSNDFKIDSGAAP